MILLGVSTLDESGRKNNGNEGVLHIPQIGALSLGCFMTHLEHLLGESNTSAEMQSVNFIATVDWNYWKHCHSHVS